jgi:chromate reductase
MADLALLGLCGSLRKASTNRLLMYEAARCFGQARFDEGDIRLPLYDGDLEDTGIPEAVTRLADQIAHADAVVVATPEYNKGISGALKNALDWVSRVPGQPWQGKPVAIVSAAAGRAGGERSQTMTLSCLIPFRPRLVTGPEVLVGQTGAQWDDKGRLINERNADALQELMDALKAEAETHRAYRSAAE